MISELDRASVPVRLNLEWKAWVLDKVCNYNIRFISLNQSLMYCIG